MKAIRISPQADRRIDDIYDYSFDQWGGTQAAAYVAELIAAFDGIARGTLRSRRLAAGMGLEGYAVRVRHHYIYWRELDPDTVGIVTILHERMHQSAQLALDLDAELPFP